MPKAARDKARSDDNTRNVVEIAENEIDVL
jgi:hypothetical protein